MFTLLAGFAMITDSAQEAKHTYNRDHMDTLLIIVNSLSFFALFFSTSLMLPCCRGRCQRHIERQNANDTKTAKKAADCATKVAPRPSEEENAQALRSWNTPETAVKPVAGK